MNNSWRRIASPLVGHDVTPLGRSAGVEPIFVRLWLAFICLKPFCVDISSPTVSHQKRLRPVHTTMCLHASVMMRRPEVQ